MQHLILGAGPAGVIAAETLRKHASGDTITVVGDEPEAPYSRMAIPYLLTGRRRGRHLYSPRRGSLRPATHHAAARPCRLRRCRRAQRRARGRDRLSFDRLLIATGSSPATPPIPGIDGPGVHPCWTLADARAIQRLARPGARVVQMGAGFIGCIILEALAARGVKLTIVEMGDRMVPRMMGPVAGAMIKEWCESKGIAVHTATRVDAIGRALRRC